MKPQEFITKWSEWAKNKGELNDEILSDLNAVNKALHAHDFERRSEQFYCGKCHSNWGEIRATCFECGHESEDLST